MVRRRLIAEATPKDNQRVKQLFISKADDKLFSGLR
jgi:hypothetical protein